MAPLFRVEQSDDVPGSTEIQLADFLAYRSLWMLYRSMGRYDGNGNWVKPISFVEAARLPKRMISTFLDLDDFFERMKRHNDKKRKP